MSEFVKTITKNEFLLQKESFLSGLLAAIIFAVGFIVTGVIADPYATIPTSLANPVAVASSNNSLAYLLIGIYDILIIFFGLVLYAQFTTTKESRMIFAGMLLIALGIVGFLLIIFSGNENGIIYQLLKTITYLITLATIGVGGYFSKEIFETGGFFIISIILLILSLLTGAIGFFILWLGILSYLLFTNKNN